ncbi:MAG TPA: PP2C family protein-serine/threonine phosphatase [Actinomycetota bacterium]|nr:PP2C family protein-serine/threonine phosphatase [Actinomycetota bacterium]
MNTDNRSLLVAMLVTTLVALLDVWIAGGAVLLGFLIAGPLLAAASLDARRTAAVATYAVLLAVLLGIPDGMFGTVDHVIRCLVVATGGVFCTFIADRRSQRERALLRITRVAEVAQRAILRPVPARAGRVTLAVRYLSAAEEAVVGGDFYDVAVTPYGVRLIVGDVKGKGLEAVQLAALVLGSFRQAAFTYEDLPTLAAELDRSASRQLGEEDFVTAVLAEFGPRGELKLVNCGHPPPLLLRGGAARPLGGRTPTTPLGLDPHPAVERLELAPADRLLLYTDGLVEARDGQGRPFQVDDKAAAELLTAPSLDQALDRLVASVLRHAGGRLDDDLALVLAQPRRLILRRAA